MRKPSSRHEIRLALLTALALAAGLRAGLAAPAVPILRMAMTGVAPVTGAPSGRLAQATFAVG